MARWSPIIRHTPRGRHACCCRISRAPGLTSRSSRRPKAMPRQHSRCADGLAAMPTMLVRTRALSPPPHAQCTTPYTYIRRPTFLARRAFLHAHAPRSINSRGYMASAGRRCFAPQRMRRSPFASAPAGKCRRRPDIRARADARRRHTPRSSRQASSHQFPFSTRARHSYYMTSASQQLLLASGNGHRHITEKLVGWPDYH